MDELGDKLSAILNDPESMERVKQMAQSLLGGEADSAALPDIPAEPAAQPGDDINIKQIVSLFSKMKNTADDSRVQLIYALRPHLSEERRARADTAIRLLKLLDMLPLIKASKPAAPPAKHTCAGRKKRRKFPFSRPKRRAFLVAVFRFAGQRQRPAADYRSAAYFVQRKGG